MSPSIRVVAPSLVLLALGACTEAPLQSPATAASEAPAFAVVAQGAEQVLAGEIVVKFRDNTAAAEILRRHGLALGAIGRGGAFVVARGAAGNEHANARALRAEAGVEWAEPNYLRTPHAIDPRLWAFTNPGGLTIRFTRGRNRGAVVGSYPSIVDVDVDNVEAYAGGGDPVIIGSIDTGVDLLHPEFAGRLILGHDWYSDDADPSDQDGHGSHTSGTMAGSTVGIAGVSGAASNVKVHVQRVCGQRGCPLSAIANAIRAAADVPGLVAMNLSLGGASLSQGESEAIAYATSKGVLVIASAGNNGSGTVSCPACDPNAISVGATNWEDVRTYYTQFGDGLDIVAPGGELFSNTTPEAGIFSAFLDGGYAYLQGTSMAAPHVTGVAGIVASARGLRGAALRARLLETTDDLGAPGYDTEFGFGRVNAYRAVTGKTLRER